MKLSLNLDYDGNIYKVEWPWVGSNSDGIYFIQNLKFDMFLCHFFLFIAEHDIFLADGKSGSNVRVGKVERRSPTSLLPVFQGRVQGQLAKLCNFNYLVLTQRSSGASVCCICT